MGKKNTDINKQVCLSMSAQTFIHSDGGLWYQYVRLFCNIRKWLTDIVKSNSIAVVGKKIYWQRKFNLPTWVIESTDIRKWTYQSKPKTRDHNKKIKKLHSRLNPCNYFFSQRVTDWWNRFKEVINAPSVDSFKNRLDRNFRDHPMMYDYRALDNPVLCQVSVT